MQTRKTLTSPPQSTLGSTPCLLGYPSVVLFFHAGQFFPSSIVYHLLTKVQYLRAVFVPVITNTGLNMHSYLLNATLRYASLRSKSVVAPNITYLDACSAPFSFFQKTDAGLTTNR